MEKESIGAVEQGATAVITHRVRDGQQAGYEDWLGEIGPLCRQYPGHLDLQIVRPITGLTTTYTIIVRFDTEALLRAWLTSDDRKRLIEKVRSLLARDDDFSIRSGLEFWFPPDETPARVPVRWKQFLVTWSAIFPLVFVIPPVLALALSYTALSGNRFFLTLIASGVIVFLMVYVIMPRYIKRVHRWLYGSTISPK